MTDCLVTGMTNVGKTCFVINFAEYMGLKELKFHLRQLAGYTAVRSYSPVEARSELISADRNYTRQVQSIKLEIPAGKVIKELEIIDSCGLSEGIHPDSEIRLAMARTLSLIRNSNLIFHIIDLANLNFNKSSQSEEKTDILYPIDKMIMEYASLEKDYVILANKIDLKKARANLRIFQQYFIDYRIIPISALYQQGFQEVKKLVLNYA